MNIVSLGRTVRPAINGLTSGRGSTDQTTISKRKVQAYRAFGKGRWSFVVRAKAKGPYGGRKGNFLNIGVYRQAGTRYIITLFEDDQDKLDGNVSTAGIDGIGATTVEAIVYKINNTVMNTWIEAEMLVNYTNQEFTNAGNINFADALPLEGGRG
jgi:hypothetical protein